MRCPETLHPRALQVGESNLSGLGLALNTDPHPSLAHDSTFLPRVTSRVPRYRDLDTSSTTSGGASRRLAWPAAPPSYQRRRPISSKLAYFIIAAHARAISFQPSGGLSGPPFPPTKRRSAAQSVALVHLPQSLCLRPSVIFPAIDAASQATRSTTAGGPPAGN